MLNVEQQYRQIAPFSVSALDSSNIAGRDWAERQLLAVVDSSTGDYALLKYTDQSSVTADVTLLGVTTPFVSSVYVAFLDSFGPEITNLPTKSSETSPSADVRRTIEEVKGLLESGMVGRARKKFDAIPVTSLTRSKLADLEQALGVAVSASDSVATGRPINHRISESIKDRYGDSWVAIKGDEVVETSSSYSQLKRQLRQKFADLSGVRLMRVG